MLYRGEPRFVIYAFGQSLIPEAVWPKVSPDPALFGMPINYRITGEVATRSVMRVDVDLDRWWEDRTNRTWTYTPSMVLERFNVLPLD